MTPNDRTKHEKNAVVLFAVLMLTGLFSGCAASPVPDREETADTGYLQIGAEQAKALMDAETDYLILDVRTAEEYAEGHIPDSVLIPDYEIRERAERELPDKDQLILVYCRSGNRSKTASAILAELGYTRVVEFGGIRNWPYDTER